MQSDDQSYQFTFSDTPTPKEVSLIKERLADYNREQTNGEYDEPGIEINLVLKDHRGVVVGGINASTMLRVMHLEALWVAKEHRKHGYGRELVLAAERIGFEKGCITSQTWSLSFQAPGFYQKIDMRYWESMTGTQMESRKPFSRRVYSLIIGHAWKGMGCVAIAGPGGSPLLKT